MNAQSIRQGLLKDEAIRDQVAHRAFQLFKQSGYVLGRDFENWLQAETEILTPMIEAELKNQTTAVEAAPAEAPKKAAKKAATTKKEAEPKAVEPKVEVKAVEPVEVKAVEPAKKATTTKSASKSKSKGGKNAESTK